jgi:hypothetical protein
LKVGERAAIFPLVATPLALQLRPVFGGGLGLGVGPGLGLDVGTGLGDGEGSGLDGGEVAAGKKGA